MALTRADFLCDLSLRDSVGLNFFDNVWPIHDPIYRISNKECQRLCDIYLGDHSVMDTFGERVKGHRAGFCSPIKKIIA